MKRIIALILAVCMLVPLTACKSNPEEYSSEYYYYYEDSDSGNAESGDGTDTDDGSSTVDSSDTSSGGTVSTNVPSKITGGSGGDSDITVADDGKALLYDTAYGKITVEKGSKAMEQGLDFGGKTFTMAVWRGNDYCGTDFVNKVKAFGAKYNCKIKMVELEWEPYISKLSQSIVTNKPYDIVFIHGSMYASGVKAGIFEDLTPYISTADLYGTAKNGGVDIARSSEFSKDGKLYGLCSNYASHPYVLYYNKRLIKQYRLKDPRELYEAGKWNWDAIYDMQNIVNPDKGIYLFDKSFSNKVAIQMAGGNLVTYKNGKAVANLTDKKVLTGLQYLQKLFGIDGSGTKAIAANAGGTFDLTEWYAGRTIFFAQEAQKYYDYVAEVESNTVFGKDKDNIGIVPIPLLDCNTDGAYPTGWLEATAACKGASDPRVAVAFAKFSSTYKNPVESDQSYSAEDEALLRKLATGKICYPNYGFSNNEVDIGDILTSLTTKVMQGDNVAQVLQNNNQSVQNCIDATLYK